MNNKDKLYKYRAYVKDVYDGDTITVDISLGFHVTMTDIKVRLIGIDTPEIRTRDLEEKARGYEVRDWLRERILGKKVLLHTKEKGKFGRWLGHIWSLEEENICEENSYNKQMITEGLAKEYFGGKRK
jgi:micrococcal nuclease